MESLTQLRLQLAVVAGVPVTRAEQGGDAADLQMHIGCNGFDRFSDRNCDRLGSRRVGGGSAAVEARQTRRLNPIF